MGYQWALRLSMGTVPVLMGYQWVLPSIDGLSLDTVPVLLGYCWAIDRLLTDCTIDGLAMADK